VQEGAILNGGVRLSWWWPVAEGLGIDNALDFAYVAMSLGVRGVCCVEGME